MQTSKFRIRNAIRSTHNFYNYNGDGQFDKDRIKGVDKKVEKRWKRRLASLKPVQEGYDITIGGPTFFSLIEE